MGVGAVRTAGAGEAAEESKSECGDAEYGRGGGERQVAESQSNLAATQKLGNVFGEAQTPTHGEVCPRVGERDGGGGPKRNAKRAFHLVHQTAAKPEDKARLWRSQVD